MTHQRAFTPPTQLDPPAAVRIRTRLIVTDRDREVLTLLSATLGSLLNSDLAAVCRARRDPAASWADRKRALTALMSARWAGAVTREANRLYRAARHGQQTALRRTEAAIRAIRMRLDLPLQSDPQPTGSTAPNGRAPRAPRGFRSAHERAMKLGRLQRLERRAERLRQELEAGTVHVCRGGKQLLRTRHHLDAAGMTVEQWRERWQAARGFIHANGETGTPYGNETIRVYPNDAGLLTVEIDLPAHLRGSANAPRGRYRLQARPFGYRREQWEEHVRARGACAYDVTYNVDKGRWYLEASFRPAPPPVPEWDTLKRDPGLRILAGDLNGGHVACCVVDRAGNPVGPPWDVPLALAGLPGSTRDGHLRDAISTIIRQARQAGCQAVICEFLDLDDARAASKEQYAVPRVRAAIGTLPTRKLRDRLVAMCARQGLAVVSVDPRQSSEWGAQHWQRALQRSGHRATVHHAAACVLGRRALGHRARRRAEVTAPHQRMEAALASADAGAEGSRPGRAAARRARGPHPPPAAARQRRAAQKTGTGKGCADAV
jgi:hypothetical protein